MRPQANWSRMVWLPAQEAGTTDTSAAPAPSDPPEYDPESRTPPRFRWWSPRRPWLPLAMVVGVLGATALIAPPMDAERRDIEAELEAKREQIRGLEGPVEARAEQIADLLEEEQDDLVSAQQCTSAAETAVDVLNALIREIELTTLGQFAGALKEHRDVARLARQTNRATKLCSDWVRPPGKPSEGDLV
jgi:hypothetical protein